MEFVTVQDKEGNFFQVKLCQGTVGKIEDVNEEVNSRETIENTCMWPNEAIFLLIETYKKYDKLPHKLSQKTDWKGISETMKRLGKTYLPMQCRSKWRNLKMLYKSRKGDSRREKDWPYFYEMDEILNKENDTTLTSVAKFSQENTEDSDKESDLWQEDITLLFLRLLQDIQNNDLPEKTLWKLISDEMNKYGYTFSPEDCCIKWQSLKYTYCKYISNSSSKGIQERDEWPYYKAVESIIEVFNRETCGTGGYQTQEENDQLNDDEILDEDSHCRWPNRAISLLIRLYQERLEKFYSGSKSQKSLWKEISEEMKKRGYIYAPVHCHSKWRSLKRTYWNRMRKRNSKRNTGRTERNWIFFYDMDDILGKRGQLSEIVSSVRGNSPETLGNKTHRCDQKIDVNEIIKTMWELNELNQRNRDRRHRKEMEQLERFIGILSARQTNKSEDNSSIKV